MVEKFYESFDDDDIVNLFKKETRERTSAALYGYLFCKKVAFVVQLFLNDKNYWYSNAGKIVVKI